MNTSTLTPQQDAPLATTDLRDGLLVLELEERLELATLAGVAAGSQRCDPVILVPEVG